MSGRLTTHVLDLSRGIPATGLTLQLWKLTDGVSKLLCEEVTNSDGRLDAPLLEETRWRLDVTSCCLWSAITIVELMPKRQQLA